MTLSNEQKKNWLKFLGLDIAPISDAPTSWFNMAKKTSNDSSAEKKPSVQPLIDERKIKKQPLLNPQKQYSTAKQLAEKSNTLEELKKSLENFEGCSLKKTASNTVFGDGNPKADLMLIGEAPGADEDLQGLPFVGMSGQLLSKALSHIGLSSREHYYITNMIPWRPPGNRQPSSTELEACLPFVKKHIELVNPKIIAFVGGTAAKTLLNTTQGLNKLRSQTTYYSFYNKKVRAFPLYHPAYLLRSPSKKEILWNDLLTLRELLDTLK